MATLDMMREMERKHGDLILRLAVTHLFDVGFNNYCSVDDVEEICQGVRERHAHDDEKDYAIITEGFEMELQTAAWELARTASIAEIICWCNRQKYFSIFEWEYGEEDGE